jgi:hypothetical protein
MRNMIQSYTPAFGVTKLNLSCRLPLPSLFSKKPVRMAAQVADPLVPNQVPDPIEVY